MPHNNSSNSTTEDSVTQDKQEKKLTMFDHEEEEFDEQEAAKVGAEPSSSGDRAVCWSRALVFAVIAIAATLIGTFTYKVINREEVEDFRSKVCMNGSPLTLIS